MAQKNYNYDTAWKKVEAFQQKGLPKSALEVVNRIYTEAKGSRQEAQQVKALVYQSQLITQVGEDTWQKNIANFEKEAAAANEPVKQILNSLTADLYYSYFQQQRYQIYQRTNTVDFKKEDPATWTITDFHTKIAALYAASLQNPKLLQQTGLEKYDPIITKGNVRKLRPTLFDLLAWKALSYFQSDERDITRPVYAFKITDMAALAAAPIFIRYEYSGKDTGNHDLLALQTFQQLLAFHWNDKDKAAFADADIQRAVWVHSKAIMPGKEQLYKELLEQIYSSNNNLPEAAQAGYLLAQWYNQKGSQYNAGTGNPEDRDLIVQAVRLLKEIIARFPQSEGGINAGNLLNEINRTTLNLQIEKVNIPEQPFRVLVQFKNFNNLHLRLIKFTDEVENALTGDDMYTGGDKYWQKLVTLSSFKNWQQSFPTMGDYRQHSAEVKVDALPVGRYMLLTSVDGNFSLNKNPLAVAIFYVSNISYVLQETDCFVLNRNDGQPLPGTKVQVSYKYYDYNSRKYKASNPKLVTTDKNGYVKIPVNDNLENRYNSQVQLDFSYGADRLKMDEGNNIYSRYDDGVSAVKQTAAQYEKENLRWFIFTDRSIYRPGQMVYFKAIGVTKDFMTRQSKIYQPGKKVTITLFDVNQQKVDTLQKDVNEYGSFNGTFRLPQTGLTGNFTIQVDESRQYISVEEYKRPKFFVEYEKLKTSFRLNEEITITGNAKAYAGNNVDGATVVYRVYRNTRWLYPWLFWRRGIWPSQGDGRTEITNGEVKTDADGKFKIAFNAQPDLSVDQSLDPTFDYTIEADVTDVSGETRSGTTTVSVGYKSLQLSLGLLDGQPIALDSLKKLATTATNLAGEKQTVQTTIKIYELLTPGRLLRSRYWTAPDTTVMDEAAFHQFFPNDPYRNENDYRTWKRGSLVLEDTFTTSAPDYELKKATLKTGWYAIEASAIDKDGHAVTTLNYVPLYDTKSGKLPSADYAFEDAVKMVVEPGENAVIYAGTSADNVFVVQQTLKADKANEAKPNATFQFLKLNNELQKTEFAATEADRGGYTINRFYVKNNRLYTRSWNISVPWANKELDISYETFRDKLLPGQEEKWKVKIEGYKGEKIAAEMLVSMYDASLDQFKPHYWSRPGVWPTNYFGSRWNGDNNFNDVSSSEKSWYEQGKYYDKRYDVLLTVNKYGIMDFDMYSGVRIRGASSMSADRMTMSAPAPSGSLDEVAVTAMGQKRKIAREVENSPVHTKFPPQADDDGVPDQFDKEPAPDLSSVSVRTNLQETAFFFPDLHTDADGNVEFSFTMPEALTQWKLQTLAHTKALAFGMDSRTTVTQKDLMVQPNAPRFFREGDRMELSAKISNLTGKELTGQAQLLLFNTATNQPVDGWFKNVFPNQYFTVAAGQSAAVKFPMEIPYNYGSALTYRIVAKASPVGGGVEWADGEESAAPVLTNRMLVTESFPLNIRNATEKTFIWQKLLTSNSTATGKGESTLTNQSLTVEFTTNPTWYAVQALPYLMEYPYECSEQNWNRLYANALASKIANSTPKIRTVFERWKTIDTAALLSNLEKNQELKQALLEETPWVMDAQNESKQKRNIALLFDMVRLSNEAAKSLAKLKEAQSSNGGFVWFKGGPDDRYITQYIVTGIGHLRKLGVLPQNSKAPADGKSLTQNQQSDILAIASRAMPYLDARLKEEYDNLIRYKANLKLDNLSSIAIQYLYAKSFFPEWQTATASKTALDYYTGQAKQFWLSRGKYEQGMIALALYRGGDAATPAAIIKSLKENSISNEEFGMYWKEFNTGGYYWYQSPIESHSLLIEAFTEIDKNTAMVNDLKTWLLKQKQTQNWRTTKATAEACYALLMQGTDWLATEQNVEIKLGNTTLSSNNPDTKAEAGTGYFKQKIEGAKVKSDMANITVKLLSSNSLAQNPPLGGRGAWGAVYWQYFENLDKITFAATPLQLTKKLFIQKNTDRGPVSNTHNR